MARAEVARSGRPRDPAVDAAILRATVQALVAEGYAGVSIEGVAARAGVGKATIYRRYADRAELVVEAVRAAVGFDDDLPDTGDLRADLLHMIELLASRLRGAGGRLLTTIAVEQTRHPDLSAELDRAVVDRRRKHLRHLVGAAVARGDLPADADVHLIAEAGPAIVWHHALHGLPMPADLPERIVRLVLGPGPAPRRGRG